MGADKEINSNHKLDVMTKKKESGVLEDKSVIKVESSDEEEVEIVKEGKVDKTRNEGRKRKRNESSSDFILESTKKVKSGKMKSDKSKENIQLETRDFKHGDLVFGKVPNYPYWPGRILKKMSMKFYEVFFYGSHDACILIKDKIVTYKTNLEKYGKNSKIKYFKEGLDEIKIDPNTHFEEKLEADRISNAM